MTDKSVINYNIYDDHQLLSFIAKDDDLAFDEIYERYWSKLYAYAYNRIRIKEICEEIIQDVFVSLWSNRHILVLSAPLSTYLYTAVKYQILNFVKSERVRSAYAESFMKFRDSLFDDSTNEQMNLNDLKLLVEKSIEELPEKCREVFRMSRSQHLSIQEIALQLNISHKTVENHLTKALKHLRGSLGDFMAIIVFFEVYKDF